MPEPAVKSPVALICLEMATIEREFGPGGDAYLAAAAPGRTSREERYETILRKPCHCGSCRSRRLGVACAGECGAAHRHAVAGI
jgi:hypothetical protein